MEHADESRTLAELYHAETKYSEDRLRNSPPISLDPSQQPEPFKEYHTRRAVSLVPFLPFEDFPLAPEHSPSAAAIDNADPILSTLSRVLYFTNGVTAIYRGPNGLSLFRAAPSAGALYPTEIYVVTEGVEGVPDGLHNYSIRRHELVPVFDGPLGDELAVCCFGHPTVNAARVTIVLTGVYERSAWRYQERSYRRVLLDTGHILGNLLHVASAEGLGPQPLGCFADDFVAQLFFFEPHQEGVMAIVPLLEAGRAQQLDRTAMAASHASCLRKSSSEGGHGGEELFLSLHRNSSLDLESLELLGSPPTEDCSKGRRVEASHGEQIALARSEPQLSQGLHNVVLKRRSTRQFSGEGFSGEDLGKILDFAYSTTYGDALPRTPRPLQAAELLDTYVVVFNNDDLESGVYRYWPESHSLQALEQGNFVTECQRICLHQDILEGASAIVVHMTHLERAVRRYGNRGYRYLHLDAGVIGQGLNLAAVDLGLGASGVGGFLDDEVNRVLGLGTEHAVVYMTVLGTPLEHDS